MQITRRYRVLFPALLCFLGVLLLLVQFGVLFGDAVVTIGIFFILVVGLDLIFGFAGQLSLGHLGTFAVGAYAAAVCAHKLGWNPWLGGAAGLVLNLLIAITLGRALLRLTGNYFVLGTFAYSLIVEAVLRLWDPVTGGDIGLGNIPRPAVFGIQLTTDLSFGVFVWLLVLASFWLALNLANHRLGRAMRAVKDDEIAAAANGIDVRQIKLNTYAVSVIYASIAGSLFASYVRAVHPDTFSLPTLLDILLMLFAGGHGTIWGALPGAALVRILPDFSGVFADYRFLVNGVVFAAVLFLLPQGFAGAVTELLRRRWGSRVSGPSVVPDGRAAPIPQLVFAGGRPPTPPRPGREGQPLLSVKGVKRYFGGVHAVDDVSFAVAEGQIKAIIGPNGAGKTTLLNLISGADRAQAGRIVFDGQDLTRLRSDQIALLGVSRTFQNLRLFDELSVNENVMVGCVRRPQGQALDFCRVAFSLPGVLGEERALYRRSEDCLRYLGIAEYRDVDVRHLSYGHRKLVELARAIVSEPRLLLLDEPVAGLNDAEKLEFRSIIAGLREKGATVLVIEHDMEFIMGLSDEVVVMNFGCTIADDIPGNVQRKDEVIAAYLGV